MDFFGGSCLFSAILGFDLFSHILLVALLGMLAWLLVSFFSIRLELGMTISRIRVFSKKIVETRQFTALGVDDLPDVIETLFALVAKEFFIGSIASSFFSIRIDHAAQLKRFNTAFGITKDELVNGFCSRVERAVTIGFGISLLSACGALVLGIMHALKSGQACSDGVLTVELLVGLLLFGFLAVWSLVVSVVMGGFLRTNLAMLNYELKRLSMRLVFLVDKK